MLYLVVIQEKAAGNHGFEYVQSAQSVKDTRLCGYFESMFEWETADTEFEQPWICILCRLYIVFIFSFSVFYGVIFQPDAFSDAS